MDEVFTVNTEFLIKNKLDKKHLKLLSSREVDILKRGASCRCLHLLLLSSVVWGRLFLGLACRELLHVYTCAYVSSESHN